MRDNVGFASPTGNIICAIDQGDNQAYVRCTLRDYSFNLPPQPSDCKEDWGDVGLSNSAEFLCVGDSISQAAEVTPESASSWPFPDTVTTSGHKQHVLPYGAAIGAIDIVCRMNERGLTCDDTATKGGFFLSKSTYEFR